MFRNALPFLCLLALSSSLSAQRQDRPQALPIPPEVEAKLDLAYAGTENRRQQLDLFLPKDREAGKKLPVLVFVHGGAWLAGDRSQGHGQIMRYVAEGRCAGVCIGYRLSPEAGWPAQIHDCKAAIRWIKAQAETQGLDAERIVVWGSSAGGHLVAMLGTSAGVPEMDGTLGPHTEEDTRVAGVIDFFGPTDVSKMNAQRLPGTMDHDGPNAPEAKLLGAPVQTIPDKVKSANPMTYVDAADPPFLIVHGDKDPLVPHGQSEILQAVLTKVGVGQELHTVVGGGHGGFRDPAVPQKVAAFLKARFEDPAPVKR
jgi:acetyl esterase/lipase